MITFESVSKIYSRSMSSFAHKKAVKSSNAVNLRHSGRGASGRALPQPALDRISLTIATGEFAFIAGPSGAGKSTFARLITREERANFGRVLIDGYDIGKLTSDDLPYYRRQLGIIFQDFRLFPSMTAIENVAFAALALGASPGSARKRARALLAQMRLLDKLNCFPSELSGGECQRVAIARALINNPKIIIADEPTGNLDPKLSLEIISLLRNINQVTGATVLVITHDLTTMNNFNENIIYLETGRLVSYGMGAARSGKVL